MTNTQREEAAAVVTLISRLLRRLYALEPEDPAMELPGAQMRVCVALLEKPRTITCLSKELGTSLSAATQLVDRLEKSGLVERYVEDDDRRIKRLKLTQRGREIMQARRDKRIDRLVKVLDTMHTDDRKLVIPVLEKLIEAGQTVENESDDMLPIDEKALE